MDNNIVISPHEGQAPVLLSQKRFILAAAGLQGGKTFCGCLWSQLEIQKLPQGVGLITALSYDQLNNVVIHKFFDMFPPYKKYFNKKDKTLYLPTGGKIFFRSLEDPRYVEGITAHWAWIDEADLCGYKGYLVVRARLSATGGRLLMTSSLADNSWLAEYMSRFSEDEFDIFTWASNKNPAFSTEEWEGLKKELDPVIFRRKYMAELSYGSGLVYGNFDELKCKLDAIPSNEKVERSIMGIDWGFVDPTAIVVISLTDKKNIYVVDDFSVEGAPMDLIVAVIKKFKLKYNAKPIYADPSNKTFLQAVQMKINYPIESGNRDIYSGTSIIRNLIFQNRFYILSNCKHTLREIKQYRFKEGLIGRSEEPEDKYNHNLDAVRYCLATHPLPSVNLGKRPNQEEADIVPFWERRKKPYQNEMKRINPLGVPSRDIVLP